jgi:cytoskeletal protein CcmA (bactofilin family)
MSDVGPQGFVDPPPAGAAVQGVRVFVLTPDIDVVGSICIDARVRLEGVVDGEIRCTSLDVTRQGEVRGQIVAETVTIYGTVTDARIYARVLVLKPGCSVEGEIYHQHLQLEAGSYFDGKSRRVDDPLAMAPEWEVAGSRD